MMRNFGRTNGVSLPGSLVIPLIVVVFQFLFVILLPLNFHSLFSDPNGRFIIISVTINGLPLLLVNIYGPNNDDPNFFLDIFSKVDQFSYTSLIVGGDFNAVLGPLDYQGSKNKHSNVKSSQMISTLMDEFNLVTFGETFIPV